MDPWLGICIGGLGAVPSELIPEPKSPYVVIDAFDWGIWPIPAEIEYSDK